MSREVRIALNKDQARNFSTFNLVLSGLSIFIHVVLEILLIGAEDAGIERMFLATLDFHQANRARTHFRVQ